MATKVRGAAFFGTVVLAPLIFAIVALLGTVAGAAAGWLANIIFPNAFDPLTKALFGDLVPAWQFGAMLGFVAGFLRASIPNRK